MAVYEQQHLRGVKPPPERPRRREKFPDLGNKAIVGLFLVTIGLSLVFWVKAEIGEWFGKEGVFSEKVVFWKGKEGREERTREAERIAEAKGETVRLVSDLQGEYAVYFKSLDRGGELGIEEERQMEAASLVKVPIMLTLYRKVEAGEMDLGTKYVLTDKDKAFGAGGMKYKQAGTVYTYKQMVELMGKSSDNTAANVLARILGKEAIQKTIDELGMMETSLEKNKTTAKEVGLMFEKLYRGEIVSEEASKEILDFLTKTDFEERIPAGVPEGVRVAHKIGTEVEVISDGGIVYGKEPYVLVILSEGVNEEEAKKALPQISKIVWEFFNAE